MTHTPGPWRAEPWTYDEGRRVVLTIQTDNDAVAQILDLWCPDDRKAESEANARLIAAAPMLLDELRETLNDLDEWDGTPDAMEVIKNNLRSMILKAI